ncbi:hypothetical protein U1Q18_043878, partial [Sarracenia purpurea var. burkii]
MLGAEGRLADRSKVGRTTVLKVGDARPTVFDICSDEEGWGETSNDSDSDGLLAWMIGETTRRAKGNWASDVAAPRME